MVWNLMLFSQSHFVWFWIPFNPKDEEEKKFTFFFQHNAWDSQVLITEHCIDDILFPNHLLLFSLRFGLPVRWKAQKKLAHEFLVFHKNFCCWFACYGHIVYKYIYGRKYIRSETNSKIESHKLAHKMNRLLIAIFYSLFCFFFFCCYCCSYSFFFLAPFIEKRRNGVLPSHTHNHTQT